MDASNRVKTEGLQRQIEDLAAEEVTVDLFNALCANLVAPWLVNYSFNVLTI